MPTPHSQSGKTKSSAEPKDAIALLKADHDEAKAVFEQFEKARSDAKKLELATKVCAALRVHMQIEEEIFYPAFLEATGDDDLNNEAIVEHEGAKKLIEEIEAMGPDDELFDAKVHVLGEMIEHHIKEEEQPSDGMFAQARKSKLDLEELGVRLQTRKEELMAEMTEH
jgi:hemerythrin superfamily protein